METYQGVKFNYRQLADRCPDHPLLVKLNYWAYLFSQLGLAPVHTAGAYGNQSFRTANNSFIITKTSMTPEKEMDNDNYTLVKNYNSESGEFLTEGAFPPSSECFLHHYIYESDQKVQAILHGHSTLLNEHAVDLQIPVTGHFYDYGTRELAESALRTKHEGHNFFILKDHGFVALGESINEAGNLTLNHYNDLITYLKRLSLS